MIKNYPTKPCKYCQGIGHFPYQCFQNPKRKKTPRTMGKYTKQWLITRRTWKRNNPPNEDGYWICYLQISPNCLVYLTASTLTLDHVVARSRDPSKRFAPDNLKPACVWCNEEKGSRALDKVL